MYEKGFNKCIEDVKEIGIDFAQKMSDLMKKCTGIDQDFISGYEWSLITLKNNLK